MRVLVTGATGFVGAPTCRALERLGFEVCAVSSRDRDLLAPGAAVALIEEIEPTHLVHLAWYAEPGRFWRAPENGPWVSATLALLQAFGDAGGRRAVLAGTCAEYDWAGDGRCSEAATPLAPATYYGACKHATQIAAAALAAQLGVSLAWGRLFFLYGPGEHPDRLVASITRRLLAGERAPTTGGAQVRDFLHVEDVGAAFAALAGSDVRGAVNVASGDGVAVRDVIDAVGRATGRGELLDRGALGQRPGEPELLVGDARRLRGEVGWEPRFALAAGVADTVAWWRAQMG